MSWGNTKDRERHPVVLEMIALRKEHGLSQQRVAEKMGYCQSHVAQVEAGVSSPSLGYLTRFAALLNKRMTFVDAPTAPDEPA